jgi:hypothetical protein
MRQGDLAGAEPLYRAAYEGRRRLLGVDHSDTLVSMNNLAALLQQKGDLGAAESMLRGAIEVQSRVRGAAAGLERTLGPDHSHVLAARIVRGEILAAEGDVAGASEVLQRALQDSTRVLGPEHRQTLAARRALEALSDRPPAAAPPAPE